MVLRGRIMPLPLLTNWFSNRTFCRAEQSGSGQGPRGKHKHRPTDLMVNLVQVAANGAGSIRHQVLDLNDPSAQPCGQIPRPLPRLYSTHVSRASWLGICRSTYHTHTVTHTHTPQGGGGERPNSAMVQRNNRVPEGCNGPSDGGPSGGATVLSATPLLPHTPATAVKRKKPPPPTRLPPTLLLPLRTATAATTDRHMAKPSKILFLLV